MRAPILLVTATAVLSACTTPTGPVDVTRFNRVAEGQVYGQGSYNVVIAAAEADPRVQDRSDAPLSTGDTDVRDSTAIPLSLSPYVAAVQREMTGIGYTRTANGVAPKYTASIRVSVDDRMVQGRSPVSVGVGGGTGGYRGGGVGVGIGLNLGGGDKPRQITRLSVRIRDNQTNAIIWEGRASQDAGRGTPAAQPGIAASKLAEALFADFPGTNAERITVE